MKTINFFAYSLMISGLMLTSCGSDDSSGSNNNLPPIGGYNSADEVGAADLLAYWPLDGDGIESISNTAPSAKQGDSYVTSTKGQALVLNNGYLDFPSIPALNIQNSSMTISCWAKMTNTKMVATDEGKISPLISFAGGTNTVGNLSLFGNTHGLVSSDSIQMKAQFAFKNADGTEKGGDCVNMTKMESWMIADNAAGAQPAHAAFPNKIGGQWAHIVYVWDATDGSNRMYVNGVKISNPAWEGRNAGVALGMSFFTPTHPTIGALASNINGTSTDVWNAKMKGEIDEIRVWKKVIAPADITALYELEKAGR